MHCAFKYTSNAFAPLLAIEFLVVQSVLFYVRCIRVELHSIRPGRRAGEL